MTISENLLDSLETMERMETIDIPTLNVGTDGHNFAPIQFVIDCSGDSIEIPNFVGVPYNNPWHLRSVFSTSRKLIVSLLIDGYTRQINTADSIIRFFSRCYCNSSSRLRKITTGKGETYYGNGNLILDKDFAPLMVPTIIYIKDEENNTIIKKRVVHFHPKVFTDDTKLINRLLAKKGMNYFLEYSNNSFDIVIDGCRNLISYNHPTGLVESNDINNFLEKNVDGVIYQFINDRTLNESN